MQQSNAENDYNSEKGSLTAPGGLGGHKHV